MRGEELERQARDARLLLEAARAFGETSDPDVVYDCFHELLADVIRHDGVIVSSYDVRDGLIRCEYAWSNGTRLDAETFPPLALDESGEGMQSRVFMTGKPLLENDVATRVKRPGGTYYEVDASGELRKLPEERHEGAQAAMMVPVKQEGAVVGVVQVMRDAGTYDEAELELLEGIVGQMAAAIRNARLQKERHELAAAEAAARAAAAEREQAARVLDAVADGVMLVDADGSVRFWNRAAERITGRAVTAGERVEAAIPGWSDIVARIAPGRGTRSVTLPVSVGGRDLWLSFVAVRTAEGTVYAFRDVTAERLLEDEKSDLIATISHELRTPMTSVYGAAQTLLRDDIELSEEQRRELVHMIARQAARLAQITEEVLLATQLDRDVLTVAQDSVDVGTLVASTLREMRAQLDGDADIELIVADGVAPALGAADRIQQVLVNLIDNAVKYGGSPVRVTVEGASDGVRVLVADSGPGIAYADQQRIFEKFYRSGPALTRATGGTGLGLYISRELVERMRGRLVVRSQPGAGATFVLELPAA